MHILFLNQYFPPDPAPTGALFADLAADLVKQGHTVALAAARQEYRGAAAKHSSRLVREGTALVRLLLDGCRQPRPDIVISGTSPPLLLLAATAIAWWHRARSIHWAMDLYPELAIELGEVSRGPVAGLLTQMVAWCYRRTSTIVALDEDMRDHLRRYGVEAAVIRPWVIRELEPVVAHAPTDPWTWIYSGNLGRAHEWATLLDAQKILEQEEPDIRLIFQGGGPGWPAAKARAAALDLERCDWQPYAPEETLAATLLAAQVCAVTQRPETRGLLWPSKLGLLLALPLPLLWIGPPGGAVARLLRKQGHTGIFAPGESREVAHWILSQKANPPAPVIPLDAALHRQASLLHWRQVIDRASLRGST